MADNKLYYGDNLDVLRRYVKDESVDLVYLDPPFNSRQDYNVLFKEKDGTKAASQITAFEDTWEWGEDSKRVYEELVERGDHVSDVMRAFYTFLRNTDMMAYLAMIAPRLIELHRVLKPTGSIYLHCDPTASHYLKMLMDAAFGTTNFKSDITWKRTSSHNDAVRQFGAVTDSILFYTKTDAYEFNVQYVPYSQSYIDIFYVHADPDGRKWRRSDLSSPHPRPNLTYEYKGWKPPTNGWRITRERMEGLDKAGRLHFPQSTKGRIQLKRYLDEMPGQPCTNSWEDIPPIHALTAERLGYPTQKPEALLERIIKTSSNEGDLILDPFCGCGTAVAVAQKLSRRWIGIDITHLAIGLIKTRLQDAFGPDIRKAYDVIGEPTDLESAKVLAEEDRFQFQAWALGLVGARTAHSSKKGSDRGIDGKLFFRDDRDADLRQIMLSVKSGGVQVKDVRDLVGVINREKAEIGVLITLEEPSKPMVREAVEAGFYKSPNFDEKVPRVQILTIEQLLNGGRIDFPHMQAETFKPAPKAKAAKAENLSLDLK